MAASSELVASLKEMRDACAAALRVIAANGLADEFAAELRRSGVDRGFGCRADRAIFNATGEGTSQTP